MDLKTLLLSPDGGDQLRSLHESGLLIDELPALAELDIKDEKSHRHKNNFYHSVKVYEQARELGDAQDIVLLTAALLHDIGKKATRSFDDKGNPTFTAHETVGARMISKALKPHGYSSKHIKLIEELVALHMRGYGFHENRRTDSSARRLFAETSSEEQFTRLIVLFKADVTTSNAKQRAYIHARMDALSEMVERVKREDELKKRRPAVNGHELMEFFALTPGPKLGVLMKYLNSEEGLTLSREQALQAVRERLSDINS